jgi:hypothetical protein
VSVERDRKVIGVMPHRIGLELRGGMMVGPGYSGGVGLMSMTSFRVIWIRWIGGVSSIQDTWFACSLCSETW